MRYFGLLLVINILFFQMIYANENDNNDFIKYDFFIGVQTGQSKVYQYYNKHFTYGRNFSIYGYWGLSSISEYLLGNIDFSYNYFYMDESDDSLLIQYSVKIGPSFYYPLFKYLQFHTGINFSLNILNLKAETIESDDYTFKPGGGIQAGFFIPIGDDFIINFNTEYTVFELSESYFQAGKYNIGISYNFTSPPQYDKKINKEELEQKKYQKYFITAQEFIDKKDLISALNYLNKIKINYTNYKTVEKEKNNIKIILESHNDSQKHINKKEFYNAIKILISIENKYDKSVKLLEKTRKSLYYLIPELEKQGITAYEHQNYSQCIQIMNKIRLIQPFNKIVKLYLPRAIKRYRVLKKLER